MKSFKNHERKRESKEGKRDGQKEGKKAGRQVGVLSPAVYTVCIPLDREEPC